MKRMLFNATHLEELRVAIVDGQKLIDLDLESAVRAEKKGNIYKAVVTKVEPGLEAAFVDYGAERQGFLPLKEIYRGYFTKYDSKTPITSVKIAQEIKEGQEMVVQVNKDERGGKGAALTTFISLAGRFVVLMPNNPKGGGISRRVSGDERMDLRQVLTNLDVGDKHALIARTAGIGRSTEELQWDLDFLLKLWETIETAATELKAPSLIYQESNLIVRSIRDHLDANISEVVIDDQEIFERAKRFMQQVMPHNLGKLKYYDDTVPLFSRYQIEHQIESAFNRGVSLPSGGSVVIDHTEALISIDVNSARATRGADIEETALQTNLEAVDEIARQLRVRDLGGLVVMDLIDMTISRSQRAVETRLKDALQSDRARVQIGKISRFGLLEMSRQRLRSSLSDANYHACPRCEGTGTIRSVVSSSLSLLRLIEERALQENTEAIQVVLPIDMATYLLNEKRHEVDQLESRLASRIIIIPSDKLASPQFQIKRLRSDEMEKVTGVPSFLQTVELDSDEQDMAAGLKVAPAEKPYIDLDQIEHDAAPAPVKKSAARVAKKPGLFSRVWKAITSKKVAKKAVAKEQASKSREQRETKPAARGRGRGGQAPKRTRGGQGRNKPQQTRRASGGNGQAKNPNAQSGTRGRPKAAVKPQPSQQPQPQSQPQPPRAAQPSKPAQPKQPAQLRPRPSVEQPSGDTGEQFKPAANDMPAVPTRRDFGAHEPSQRVGQRISQRNTEDDMPAVPTRRDFGAHEPSQRVGHRDSQHSSKAMPEDATPSSESTPASVVPVSPVPASPAPPTPTPAPAPNPNQFAPMSQTPQDIPDDIGNR